ncbi:hypothetical protein VNO77_02551 [Canavalia gladiata]|uniref:Uncharacterized protein n=1 Tax=Canavalia gladiata TaxID=3824 RepID=A0AAN9R679_CANGL
MNPSLPSGKICNFVLFYMRVGVIIVVARKTRPTYGAWRVFMYVGQRQRAEDMNEKKLCLPIKEKNMFGNYSMICVCMIFFYHLEEKESENLVHIFDERGNNENGFMTKGRGEN